MRLSSPAAARLAIGAALAPVVGAVDIDWTSTSSIKAGAATIAYGMMGWYTGNLTGDTPGNLPDPYYWWECGAMFGTLVDYWHYTGDESYVNVTYQAMEHQMGDDGDFMPTNQTRTEGNDDQGFWAMASMSAAEYNFKDPGDSGGTSWLGAVQSVFNEYAYRWQDSLGEELCNGGLRWQIFAFNNGYEYKNSIANGCFFNIGARLARYTANASYAEWAEKIYDWQSAVGFITDDGIVYDGATTANHTNCSVISDAQWTYNHAIFMHGAAVMYNYTNGSSVWAARAHALLNHSLAQFFPADQIMVERACEPNAGCTTDSLSFKAYMARWMAASCLMMADLCDSVEQYLLASGKAAATQCTGTAAASRGFQLDGIACGGRWNATTWDGTAGVGQQMSALSAVLYSQVRALDVAAPFSTSTGGKSRSDASGGSAASSTIETTGPVTSGDRVGAGFLTTFALAGLLSACAWMVKE